MTLTAGTTTMRGMATMHGMTITHAMTMTAGRAAHHPRRHAYVRHASGCVVRCHQPRRRTVAYRIRRAGERG